LELFVLTRIACVNFPGNENFILDAGGQKWTRGLTTNISLIVDWRLTILDFWKTPVFQADKDIYKISHFVRNGKAVLRE
jgi:hypothetical protein